ncbi:MAG: haloacid dehalogenase type II [Pseudomonadota bacterium]
MPKAYIFDAYGTLFDVHAAVRSYAEKLGPDSAAISETWRQKQLEYTWVRTLAGEYQDFWELTQQALDFALAKYPSANTAMRDDLLNAYFHLEAYEEVGRVLGGLKESGAQTGILSNGSSAMLEAAVENAGLAEVLDNLISVDTIQMFKPRREVYHMVPERMRVEAQDVSFQSSNRWDIAGAKAFGFTTVWCNRTGQPDEYADMAADRVISDLRELV